MQFICVVDSGPGFPTDSLNGGRTEPGQVRGVGRVEEASGYHQIGAPLFRGRIVQERVGTRVQDFLRQGRGAAQVAAMETDLAVLIVVQYFFQPVNIHQVVQAIIDSLLNQWVLRYFPFLRQVILAGQLVGEYHCHQVLRVASLELGGHFLSFVVASDSQGCGGVPAPMGGEHGRRQQCLGDGVPDRGGVQVTGHILKGETVDGAQ